MRRVRVVAERWRGVMEAEARYGGGARTESAGGAASGRRAARLYMAMARGAANGRECEGCVLSRVCACVCVDCEAGRRMSLPARAEVDARDRSRDNHVAEICARAPRSATS